MNSKLLSVYNRLPNLLRSPVASARGAQLRSWRYGLESERLVQDAFEREGWTIEQWKDYHDRRLGILLHRAVTRVPYYREQWATRRRHGDKASWDYLENWPVLEKEALRSDPRAFVADDCDVRRMLHEHTSGTSGKPVDLWQSRATTRAWYALFEARTRRWYGVHRRDRWAILGGQMVTPVRQRRPPFWVWNAPLHQLYMSSYHLAPDLVSHYLNAIQRYRMVYLLGYTSALYALAQGALRLKRNDLRLAVVITNAEPLVDYQREVISQAFHCPVRETYGMSEIVFAGSECTWGRMHSWPESGVAEVIQNDQSVPAGKSGDLVCTGLLNLDMPLIRYRVGDRSTLPSNQEPCRCGRTLPNLASIEGRVDDVLYTRDGRGIGRLDPVFKGQLGIREAQIVQEAFDSVRLRFVPAPEYTPAHGQMMIERIRQRMGDIEVLLDSVGEIPRTTNGKFRAVICNLPPSVKESLRQMPSTTRT